MKMTELNHKIVITKPFPGLFSFNISWGEGGGLDPSFRFSLPVGFGRSETVSLVQIFKFKSSDLRMISYFNR